jgi:hypothetical protein
MRRIMFLLGLSLLPDLAQACTTVAFTDPGRPLLAYNFDFHIGQGVVLINKRGLDKMSETQGNPARWHARFASITFNMFGRDSPMTGMNEAGLTASQMWFEEARYEEADERPTIGVLEWMQYVLDTSASVDEALANIRKVRIESRIPLHYKLMDAAGHTAVVEFLDGEAVIRRGSTLPYAALANDSYASSLDFAEDVAGGKAQAMGSGSLSRFMRAGLAQQSKRQGGPIAFAFATLDDVAQPQRTQWSIVYDTARRMVHWRTPANKEARSAGFDGLDLTCAMPPMQFSIHEGRGEVSHQFRSYRSADNERLLFETVRATPFLAGIDDQSLRQSALWPDSTSVCHSK